MSRQEHRKGGCPCEWTTPCSPHCSCAHPVMSGGCMRCCRYGNDQQRLFAAERIANALSLPEKASALLNEWVTKQGHEGCWHYPEIFLKLCDLFGVDASKMPVDLPRDVFEGGCVRFQIEKYGPKDTLGLTSTLADLKRGIKGELDRGYVLTHEPMAGDLWRRRWNKALGQIEDMERMLKHAERSS